MSPINRDYGVVIVTYNGELYIKEQVESILQQTKSPSYIAIVDDNSSDNSISIIINILSETNIPYSLVMHKSHSINDLRTRISSNFRLAVSYIPRNIQYVIFSDQDDVWAPTKADVLISCLEQNPKCNMAFSNGYLFTDELTTDAKTIEQQFQIPAHWASLSTSEKIDRVILNPFVVGATCICNRAWVQKIKIPKFWLHDRWLSIVAVLTNSLDYVPTPTTYYRLHDKQVIGIKKNPHQKKSIRFRILIFQIVTLFKQTVISSPFSFYTVSRVVIKKYFRM